MPETFIQQPTIYNKYFVMTKKSDKQILFERMNKVGGMPLNENQDALRQKNNEVLKQEVLNLLNDIQIDHTKEMPTAKLNDKIELIFQFDDDEGPGRLLGIGYGFGNGLHDDLLDASEIDPEMVRAIETEHKEAVDSSNYDHNADLESDWRGSRMEEQTKKKIKTRLTEKMEYLFPNVKKTLNENFGNRPNSVSIWFNDKQGNAIDGEITIPASEYDMLSDDEIKIRDDVQQLLKSQGLTYDDIGDIHSQGVMNEYEQEPQDGAVGGGMDDSQIVDIQKVKIGLFYMKNEYYTKDVLGYTIQSYDTIPKDLGILKIPRPFSGDIGEVIKKYFSEKYPQYHIKEVRSGGSVVPSGDSY